MTHRKQAASIKKEKNSFTPAAKTQKPAALSKPVVAGRDLLDAHVAALHDPRWTSNQKQALARQINQTYGNHHLQRILAAAPATIQRKQKTYNQAQTMADYLALVHAAEQKFVGRSPRQMLALLRRVYFGKETWSLTTRKQWEDVLPKSPTMGDPRSQLGKGQGSLFAALQASQVVAGTDIGHLLTGLEALLNPKKSVEVEVFGPNPVVKMPNTEFATWGGILVRQQARWWPIFSTSQS
jgi:hypothetical protein